MTFRCRQHPCGEAWRKACAARILGQELPTHLRSPFPGRRKTGSKMIGRRPEQRQRPRQGEVCYGSCGYDNPITIGSSIAGNLRVRDPGLNSGAEAKEGLLSNLTLLRDQKPLTKNDHSPNCFFVPSRNQLSGSQRFRRAMVLASFPTSWRNVFPSLAIAFSIAATTSAGSPPSSNPSSSF